MHQQLGGRVLLALLPQAEGRDAGVHVALAQPHVNVRPASYPAHVRAQGHRFRGRGLTAAYGCSSLPGLSLALARLACRATAEPPERARITLFIGNNNRKSTTAAMRRTCAPRATAFGGAD